MTLQLGDTTLGVRCDDHKVIPASISGGMVKIYINPRKSGGVLRVLYRKYDYCVDNFISVKLV